MKRIILTGANGDIGKNIFSSLHNEGYICALWIRKENKAFVDFLEDIKSSSSSFNHLLIHADLESNDEIKKGIEETKKWSKKFDAIINCAGYPFGSLANLTPLKELEKSMQINFFAPIQLIQAFSRGMITNKGGKIINIASIQGSIAERGNLAYGSSKAAIIHATKIIAQELGVYGISVNSISPTAVVSKMSQLMNEDSLIRLKNYSATNSEITTMSVSDAVMFLLDYSGNSINGIDLKIHGGMPF